MKKTLALLLVCVLTLTALCSCDIPKIRTVALGSTGFTVKVDGSYTKGKVTSDDTTEGQVAYYFSENSLLDFDIYQWTLATDETLADAANEEAADYDATASKKTFGDITVYAYNATEESEGKEYKTVSYLMENDGTVAEIVFWLDGENADAQVEKIMNTLALKPAEVKADGIRLGTSTLYVAPAKAYKAGEISKEDTDENQVAYFTSDDTLVDFDVYMWAKATDETLEAAAAEEAKLYGAEVKNAEFNGIKVAYYNAVEEIDEDTFNTVSYIAEDGDFFVEVVIWLDGETADAEAAQIIGSLTR